MTTTCGSFWKSRQRPALSSKVAVTYSTELPSASRAAYWCAKKGSSAPPTALFTVSSTRSHAMVLTGCVPMSSLAMA